VTENGSGGGGVAGGGGWRGGGIRRLQNEKLYDLYSLPSGT
jgi:hypothetical protein